MQTKTGVTTEELAAQLTRFVMSSMRTAQTEIFQVVADLDLSMTQLKILHILDNTEQELTPSELAGFIGLSAAATGRAVDGLVRSGIVTRREDDADRRVKRLALSEVGQSTMSRINAARAAGLAKIVSTLTPEQRDALSAALTPLLPDSPNSPGCSS